MFCSCFVVAAISVLAQKDNSEVLQVTTRLVSIDVLVTDKRNGARVENLKQENFEVFDDNLPVSLTHFSYGSNAERPLAVSLIVDVSPYRTKANVPKLRAALEQALRQLRPEDDVAVFDFSRDFEMVQELTNDRASALAALEKTAERQKQPFKSTGKNSDVLSKVLVAAVNHAKERRPKSRVALVVISDDVLGIPSAQLRTDTENALLVAGATVNGLIKVSGLLANAIRPVVASQITRYSEQTGGEIAQVKGDNYSDALEQIIGDVVGRYGLGFEPVEDHIDGRFHKLTVKVKLPNEGKSRKILIRYRKGYVAVKGK